MSSEQIKLLEMQVDRANNNIHLLKEAIELKDEAISLYREVIQHYKSEVARLSSRPIMIPNMDNQRFSIPEVTCK